VKRLLLALPFVGGLGAWLFGDLAVAVSLGFCAVYVILWSVRLPLEDFIHLATLKEFILSGGNCVIDLPTSCNICATQTRHAHMTEILGSVASEKQCAAYGASKLSETLLIDVRHSWESGIGGTLILLLIWGVLSFAKIQTPPVQPFRPSAVKEVDVVAVQVSEQSSVAGNSKSGSDVWKVSLTLLFNLYKLVFWLDFLHWFRKQNQKFR
jgi:hypothetical protein